MKLKKIIIAGGGTGGHIFPAIAVANALRKIDSYIDILFVGAQGKMEMEKVPQAGYQIRGLDIAGFNRSSLLKNWNLPFKLIKSYLQVKKIFKSFQPDAVFGVGGYSTFPVLKYAQRSGIPTFLHEANSFAGRSNMMLAKNADLIMVASANMDRFFPTEKLFITGNPVRSEIAYSTVLRSEAFDFFRLREDKPTLLVIGGSQGSRSINKAILGGIDKLLQAGIQVIWQSGKGNLDVIPEPVKMSKQVCAVEFISKMNYAYTAADLVVSRSGAIALAEICAFKKPSILIPLPHAAEDHQTVNASVLVSNGAALMVKDTDANNQLVEQVISLIKDVEKCKAFGEAAGKLFVPDADVLIANKIIETLEKK